MNRKKYPTIQVELAFHKQEGGLEHVGQELKAHDQYETDHNKSNYKEHPARDHVITDIAQ